VKVPSYESINKGEKAMVGKTIRRVWDAGRQKLIYVLENSPFISNK